MTVIISYIPTFTSLSLRHKILNSYILKKYEASNHSTFTYSNLN